MSPELVSKEDLLAAGWKDRQIEAALDEPDEVGPSGHWLNTSGKPFYDKDRVAVAAYRSGHASKKPTSTQWQKWAECERPTSPPVLTFDFHRLAEECIPDVSREFWSLRLSHPVMGRRGGTREAEKQLIDVVLIKLIELACEVHLAGQTALEHYLSERAVSAAGSLGPHWPGNITARPAKRASYVSKAMSKKTMQRFIDAISLVHAGSVLGPTGLRLRVSDFLVYAPRLRFDRKSLNDV